MSVAAAKRSMATRHISPAAPMKTTRLGLEKMLAIVKNDAYEGDIFEKRYSKRKGCLRMNIRRDTCNMAFISNPCS